MVRLSQKENGVNENSCFSQYHRFHEVTHTYAGPVCFQEPLLSGSQQLSLLTNSGL